MITNRKFSTRIVRRHRKNWISIQLSVCHHLKDPVSKSPTHKQLFAVGSFRDIDVNNESVRRRVWKEIDEGCLRLLIKNGMTNESRTRINRVFNSIIKMPSKVAASSTPTAPPTVTVRQTLSERFPLLNLRS